jgi:hypothetical protein
LEAAVPKKRKKKIKVPPFIQVPIWFAEMACKALEDPKAMVWLYLLHLYFKTKRTTFPVPNVWLEKRGVERRLKCRVLTKLAAAGLITIEWRRGRSPIARPLISFSYSDSVFSLFCSLFSFCSQKEGARVWAQWVKGEMDS